MLAKLHAYGLSLSVLKLIHNYLKNRKQRTKIDLTYSSWEEILSEVPQGPILGPFFSINETDYANYADDNTPYVTGDSVEDIINSLENDSMKANKDKYHLLISGSENITINVDGNIIGQSICETLLRGNVDYKLKFNEHLHSILKKT